MRREPIEWPIPEIALDACTGCGICVADCPTHAIAMRFGKAEIVHPAACTFCDRCEQVCPTEAIARPFTIMFAPEHPARMGSGVQEPTLVSSTTGAVWPVGLMEMTAMTTTTATIDANETLNALVARAPETMAVFQHYGLDTCCGGSVSLATAAQHHNLDLQELLTALRAALGEPVVDVRTIMPRDRHPLIFHTFDTLNPGAAFTLVNDHDPKPLFYQFSAERSGQFTWTYLEQGPQTWRVQIAKSTGP